MKNILWMTLTTFLLNPAIASLPTEEPLQTENENQFLNQPDNEDFEYFLLHEDGTLSPLNLFETSANAQQPKGRVVKKRKGRNCDIRQGRASYYGDDFAGRKTANGEIFDPNDFTAAHKTLRFNSIVRVTYRGQSVDVRINDDGPHIKGRVIDLSEAAAEEIGLIAPGHAPVTLELIECG